MKTWTMQTGYPLLTLEKEAGGYKVSQSRFLSSGKAGKGAWSVPVSIMTNKGTKTVGQLLPDKPLVFQESDFTAGSWIKLNAGQVGFYRTKYTEDQFSKLQEVANTLPFVDRLGLFSDG